jgi:Methylamine utilisation protein MauE
VSVLVDPVFGLLAAAAVALLLGAAGGAKLRNLTRFTAVLEAYDVMPTALAWIVAVVLPFIELTLAVCLLVNITRPSAAVAAACLLFIYGAGIAVNLVRGRRDLDCGCEGFGRRRSIAGWMVARNALMIAVAALAGAPQSARALEVTDVLTIFGGLAAFALVYFAADELLGRSAPA